MFVGNCNEGQISEGLLFFIDFDLQLIQQLSGDIFGAFNQDIIYTGQFLKGKPHGKGVLQYAKIEWKKKWGINIPSISEVICDIYQGNFENGLPSGNGTLTLSKNKTFYGQFFKGKPHGIGIINPGNIRVKYLNGILQDGPEYSDEIPTQ